MKIAHEICTTRQVDNLVLDLHFFAISWIPIAVCTGNCTNFRVRQNHLSRACTRKAKLLGDFAVVSPCKLCVEKIFEHCQDVLVSQELQLGNPGDVRFMLPKGKNNSDDFLFPLFSSSKPSSLQSEFWMSWDVQFLVLEDKIIFFSSSNHLLFNLTASSGRKFSPGKM